MSNQYFGEEVNYGIPAEYSGSEHPSYDEKNYEKTDAPVSVIIENDTTRLMRRSYSLFKEWLLNRTDMAEPMSKIRKTKLLSQSEPILDIGVEDQTVDESKWEQYLEQEKIKFKLRFDNPSSVLVSKKDFIFIRTIGTGAFSKVMLVKNEKNKRYYSAKVIPKIILIRNKYIHHAKNEKRILQAIRFIFTIHLEFFFQDNVYVFFVMPFVNGGELFTYLTKVNRIREDDAKIYSAQMLLALEYLHYMGLIFRDLKPENVLIDAIGYLKLTDFGFCKEIKDRTYTFCGTTEYLAPEMLNSRGYGKSVDWWAFGVFIFELCSGDTPFQSKVQTKIYENISKCNYKVPFYFSNDLKDLIKNLLKIDLSKRFGNLKDGVSDIKNHKWYEVINWKMIVRRQIPPPFLPFISRADDTSNFPKQKEEPFKDEPVDKYADDFANF